MRIYSLELIVQTAKTSDANTDDRVTVKFNDAMGKYYLDLFKDDREKGQTEVYNIVDDKIKTIRDLKYLRLEKERTDAWAIAFVSIKVNGYQIYYNNMEANPFTIDGDDGYKPSVT